MIALGENNEITLTRGDTAVINVDLTIYGETYELSEGETLVLTVKVTSWGPKVLLEKTADSMSFQIKSEDTAELSPGTYYYDVRLRCADGASYTVVPRSAFIIKEAVAWR